MCNYPTKCIIFKTYIFLYLIWIKNCHYLSWAMFFWVSGRSISDRKEKKKHVQNVAKLKRKEDKNIMALTEFPKENCMCRDGDERRRIHSASSKCDTFTWAKKVGLSLKVITIIFRKGCLWVSVLLHARKAAGGGGGWCWSFSVVAIIIHDVSWAKKEEGEAEHPVCLLSARTLEQSRAEQNKTERTGWCEHDGNPYPPHLILRYAAISDMYMQIAQQDETKTIVFVFTSYGRTWTKGLTPQKTTRINSPSGIY